MNTPDTLRAMAAYIREHGFITWLGFTNGPRCFCGAYETLYGQSWDDEHPVLAVLANVVGAVSYAPDDLSRAGWTNGYNDDAAAACEIAADLATP